MGSDKIKKVIGVSKPYYRNFRMPLDGKYGYSGSAGYVSHPGYARSPEHYVKAYLLILKDLQELFSYIEPDEMNSKCYSFRVHELFVRTCIEVEANFKAILNENGYKKKPFELNMKDYEKVNATHKLSFYKVELPFGSAQSSDAWVRREPFKDWRDGEKLQWYNDYHAVKHDRHNEFKSANLNNLINAVCGLLVLLSSQFYTDDFSGVSHLVFENSNTTIGGYFKVIFPEPKDWPEEERYCFDWCELGNEENIFQQYDYNA